jgi:opine dehydrogenase
MARKPSFAIIGAGNGGLTMAGDLVLHGFEVSGLHDRLPEAIAPIQKRGGIELVGEVLSGFAPITNATTDIARAVRGADVIAVVVPAFAHESVAAAVAPHLEAGQIILLTPGYPGGTLLFRRTLEAHGLRATVDLAETNLILYATRMVGPAQVGVQRIKKTFWISALPATRTGHVLDVLKPAIPQLQPLANILEVGFNCTNPLAHVPTVLLNLGTVERIDANQHFDPHDWITPGILRVKDALDDERGAVVRAMGLRYMSHAEVLDRMYGDTPVKIVPMQGPVLEGSRSVPPRYLSEDVPMGLVPWASMGRKLGVATPTVEMMIHLAGLVSGADFWKEGRTMERLGLADKDAKEILRLVNG